ncbi:MAG: 1-deoxy-D-xylulose-5-phosphate synthase [Acetivibrionales bacterium]|jgi:1-deoxy-D-xylulose-5-phosphate synthase
MGVLLDTINSLEDFKKLDIKQMEQLSIEIREFLVESVSKTGGHLAANLGIVELTLALHKVFDSPKDKIIWDVGHQSYVHKIITGRKKRFETLRKIDGISGFPKTNESIHDAFNTGHSSTSISAALGMARARDISKESYSVIAVIGDGALTGGMAFEALNDAGRSVNDLIVVLNDNEMSISKNVGGLSRYLSNIRTEPLYFKVKEDIDTILNKIPAIGKSAVKALDMAKGTIKYVIMPGMFFEELGFKYLGPIDGHDLNAVMKVLSRAKRIRGPILIHVRTQKGRGYKYAEKSPQRFHGISPFEVETGELLKQRGLTYSDVFGREISRLAEKDAKIVAITAAMPHATGLDLFANRFRERLFDVGIAEQHAVTMAAGMAKMGLKPVVAIYSSFLQRAYDQILHDVALQNLNVLFAIDRAGIVGEDGETHQGIYDFSFLTHIPNMTIMAPSDYNELSLMLEFALFKHQGPVAIRYPRGKGCAKLMETKPVVWGQGVIARHGTDVTIIAVGDMLELSIKVAQQLEEKGISAEVINPRFVKPLDEKMIVCSAKKTSKVVTIENNTVIGGFGSTVLQLISQKDIDAEVKICGFPDRPIYHGSKEQLFERYRLDCASLVQDIIRFTGTKINRGVDIIEGETGRFTS